MNISEQVIQDSYKSIESYEAWVEQVRERTAYLKQYLPQYLPHRLQDYARLDENYLFVNSSSTGHYIQINMPWNPKLYDEIALLLAVFEWELDSERKVNSFSGPEYWTKHTHTALPDFHIAIHMESGKKGSTCQLVQVGTEIKENPIWEVRCADDFSVEDL